MKNYKTDEELETPYERARQVIDDRVGSARKQAFSWRLFGLGALFVALIAVIGVIYQSSKASVIPYIVEVDGAGAVRLVGSPTTQQWKPTEGVKRHFLEEWLWNVRALSSDKEVVRKDLLEAYTAVTSKAKAQLDTLVEETEPFERLGKETRQLEISSINKVSEDSYRLEWREKIFGKSGYVEGTEQYVGILTIMQRTPNNKAELEKNPLGIYVKHFSINKRATSADEADAKAEADEGGQ